MRRRTLLVASVLVGVLHVVVLLAGFLAPHPYDRQHRNYPYAPPSHLHFRDPAGRFHLRPFVYALVPEQGSTVYREDPSQSYRLQFFVWNRGPRLIGVEPSGVLFLLGSDGFGRDVLSRLLYGARVSLLAGLLAAALALAFGVALGGLSGYFGGWLDRLLMRGGELVLSLPWLFLLLAVRAFLPLHIAPLEAFFLLVGIIGCVGWVRPARLIRGVVLSARERGFVQAARGFGASHFYVLRRHILPVTGSVAWTQATVLVPRFVLAEVTLSFLGLGVGEPVPSWGNMLVEARQYHTLVTHPWMLAPAAAMVLMMFGYLLLADALIEANQP
jgi:peptide/nickel transport system permease protein